MKVDTGILYLTFKLLKRRYRSIEGPETSRRLDYFNHPFEEGNEIKLIDDFGQDKSVSLYSLSTNFNTEPDNGYDGKGSFNAIKRKEIHTDNLESKISEYEPFNVDNAVNY